MPRLTGSASELVRIGDRLCCTIRTTYVLTDLERTPTPVPEDLQARWVG